MSLRPCTGCLRHVRSNEARCPFCDQPLEIETRAAAPTGARLSRAATMAFGAAIATASLAGCDEKKPPADPTVADVGPAAADDAASSPPVDEDAMPQAKPYGAPPADGLLV